MSTPIEHNKLITDQAEMNRLFGQAGGEGSLADCQAARVRDESFDPAFHQTIRKELWEYHRDGQLVALIFRYTRQGGETRLSPKMLLIGTVRHCC
jgi:hypothetical protein